MGAHPQLLSQPAESEPPLGQSAPVPHFLSHHCGPRHAEHSRMSWTRSHPVPPLKQTALRVQLLTAHALCVGCARWEGHYAVLQAPCSALLEGTRTVREEQNQRRAALCKQGVRLSARARGLSRPMTTWQRCRCASSRAGLLHATAWQPPCSGPCRANQMCAQDGPAAPAFDQYRPLCAWRILPFVADSHQRQPCS